LKLDRVICWIASVIEIGKWTSRHLLINLGLDKGIKKLFNYCHRHKKGITFKRNSKDSNNLNGRLQMKKYVCLDCQFSWELREHAEEPVLCPKCGSRNIVGLVEVLEE